MEALGGLKESLPPGLADAAINIPGFGAIIQLVLKKLGFDVGNTMSLYLLLFGIFQVGMFIFNRGRSWVLDFGTSAIQIDDNDDLYPQFISWISEQRMTEVSRDLKATSRKPRRGDDSDAEDSDSEDEDVLDESGIFNYDKYKGTKPVYYEPNVGENNFTYKGHYFQFRKDAKENKFAERIEYFLVIRCMGRSTQPIKDLIEHVREWSAHKPNSTTEIMRADVNRHGSYWAVQSNRPSRPISTVTLDEAQKNKVVADINEYLHPATARWYAARGIPHRRGYLFHGPPGTGKTSLSFAIAGIFGLSVYCASLSEREMTESDLAGLFGQLPNRCIVLLEDIDSAGIRRDRSSTTTPDPDPSTNVTKTEKPPTRATDKETKANDEEGNKSKISLAGLLNVIDGAASSEGRVLIMTTNYPEKLDSALIRPGRVDLQIKFTLATNTQMQEIFRRMYSTEEDLAIARKNDGKAKDSTREKKRRPKSANGITTPVTGVVLPQRPSFATLPAERLAEMAKLFTDALPGHVFSPAEIQGYLLQRKSDPEGALRGVAEWRDGVLQAKRKGTRVIEVN